jgi:membrane protease YdiL (CAAX protease family)
VDPGPSSPSPDHLPTPQPPPNPPRWGIGDFIWIYVAGLVAAVVAEGVGFAITGDTADHIGAVTLALASLGQFGTWFGGVVLVARTKGRSAREDFGLTLRRRDWWVPFAGIAVFFAFTALVLPLVHLAGESQQVVNDLDNASGAKLAVFVVVALVIAPVCEELMFRGLLLQSLRRRMSPEWAVIVQALAFALAHPMLSPTLGDFAVVPALFALGAVSGIVAVRRGDLSASIMLHVGFNFVTSMSAL